MTVKNTNPHETFGNEDDLEIRVRKLERMTRNLYSQLETRMKNSEKKIKSLESK